MSADDKYWLSVADAARACSLSRDTIKRYLRAGKFPNAHRLDGANSAWRISVGDLFDAGLTPELTAKDSPVQVQRATKATREQFIELEVLRAELAAALQLIESLERNLADLRLVLRSRGDH